MAILATLLKASKAEHPDYFNIHDITSGHRNVFFMNSVLKVGCTKFDVWYSYWENSPIVVKSFVAVDSMSTGYAKISVLKSEIISIDDCGEYPSSSNVCFCEVSPLGKLSTVKVNFSKKKVRLRTKHIQQVRA